MTPEQIKQRFDALSMMRKPVEQTWDLIEKFIMPIRAGKFFQEQSSEAEIDWRRGRDVYDSTAILAANTLASSIHGSLTSPSVRWFSLRFRNEELNVNDEAVEWLQACAEEIWFALLDSDFNLEVNEAYLDLVAFGTSCVVEEAPSEVEWEGLDFSTLPIREIYFEQDSNGRILRFYRRLQWTALQIISRFGGDNVPEKIRTVAEQPAQADRKFTVIFCVYERARDANTEVNPFELLAPEQRPYASRYVLHETAEPLGEPGGYYEMPAYLPRWQKASGSMWGFGPGTIALSDVMTLNTAVEQRLTAAAKVIDPPSLVTERGLMSDLDLTPGGQTVVRTLDGIAPYESGARFDVADNLIFELRTAINRIFLVDRLELKESPAMTATEVNARYDLMQRLLGPVFGRLQTDLLDPLISRTFRILWRAGRLPPVPAALNADAMDMDVEYLGPLARAQKSENVSSIIMWAQQMTELGQFYPETAMLVDAQAMGRELAKSLNVPATIVRSEAEVDQLLRQREQEALQQRQIELAMGQGEAAKALGEGAQALSVGETPVQ